jgi:hypothetical protein
MRIQCRILVRKHFRKQKLGRTRKIWVDNIKMGVRDRGCKEAGGWNYLWMVSNDRL